MSIDRRDPETKEFLQARYENACKLFREAKIGKDTFAALLHGLGYRGAELKAEIALNWPSEQAIRAATVARMRR